MTARDPQLILQSAPFLRRGVSTPSLMFDVILALLPVWAAALWFFGLSALLVPLAAIAGCLVIEGVWGERRALTDGSAAVTGLILGLTLPPGLPLWMAFLGGIIAIGLGKLAWGGLGHNLFNPALVGRAFLQAAFPTALTTWSPHGGSLFSIHASNFAAPLMSAGADVVSTATPLARMKFEHQATDLASLLIGNTAGSLGETSALVIVGCGLYLALRRTFDWRLPVSILLTVLVLAGVIYGIAPDRYPAPWFMLASGGLLFGTVFMATDPVTTPLSPKGAWIFGFGVGALVVLIRLWGGLPEGVMYAILLMNSATPLIERYTQPRPFGRGSAA